MSSSKPIAKQISSISGILIGGLILLSLFAMASTILIKSTFSAYRETAQTTLTANMIFEDVYDKRIAALAWRVDPTAAGEEGFADKLEELRATISSQAALSDDGSEFASQVEVLNSRINEYETEFARLTSAYAQYDAAQGDLRVIGIEARQALTDLMGSAYQDGDMAAAFYAARAQKALMLGRYYLADYGHSHDTGDLDRSRLEIGNSLEEVQNLRGKLNNAERVALADRASTAANAFAAATNTLIAAWEEQVLARQALDTIGPQIIREITQMMESATEQQSTLGPRGEAISFWAVAAICLAAVCIVAIGWRASQKMAKSISREIEDSVDTMAQIADGNLDANVAHTEKENEVGRMARALEVFKTNGKAAIAAAEQAKREDEDRREAAEQLKREQQEKEEVARAEAEAARQEMIADLSQSLGNVVAAASSGDFTKRVEANFEDAELSALAKDVNLLVQSVDRGLRATTETLERVASGDLTSGIQGEFQGAFKDLQDNTNDMLEALKGLMGDITGSATNLASSSSELRDTSADLSRQAEQNAASLEETSAALEELTASIKQVNENVTDANKNARVASDTAKSSSTVASAAAEAMGRISDASSEIAKVVSVINDIAFQINLLALNAGVEAARAGEAGRGFSVVASEVRQLAQRASEAAKEIDDVIARSDHAVSEGVSKVTDAQASFERISDSVVGVSNRIDEITHAISEQVQGIDEIHSAVSQIDQNTQKQAASFEEVTAASSLLSSEAEGLEHSTSRFKTGQEPVGKSRQKSTQVDTLAPAKRSAPVAVGNTAIAQDDWDEF